MKKETYQNLSLLLKAALLAVCVAILVVLILILKNCCLEHNESAALQQPSQESVIYVQPKDSVFADDGMAAEVLLLYKDRSRDTLRDGLNTIVILEKETLEKEAAVTPQEPTKKPQERVERTVTEQQPPKEEARKEPAEEPIVAEKKADTASKDTTTVTGQPTAQADTTAGDTLSFKGMSVNVQKTTADTTTTLLQNTTQLLIQQDKGFVNNDLIHQYDYLDKEGISTRLSLRMNFDGQYASMLLEETKGNKTITLLEEQATWAPGIGLPSFEGSFRHDHQELQLDKELWKKGRNEQLAGSSLLGAAFISQVALRYQPDIVYQDYNDLGFYHDDNPYKEDNESESTREQWHTAWQVANIGAALVGTYYVIKGTKDKKSSLAVTPVSIGYKLNF